jgi:hypothetical protein
MRLRRPRHLTVASLTVVDDVGRPVASVAASHGGGVISVRIAADPTTGADLVALPDPDGEDSPILGVHHMAAGEDVTPDR